MKKYHYWVTAALSLVGLAVTAAGSLQLANPPQNVKPTQLKVKKLPSKIAPIMKVAEDSVAQSETPAEADTTVAAYSKVWDFHLSDQTLEFLDWDANNAGYWQDWGDRYYCYCHVGGNGTYWPFVFVGNYYDESTGETDLRYFYIPELRGLALGSIYEKEASVEVNLYKDGTDKLQWGNADCYLAIENMYAGTEITIEYSSADGWSWVGFSSFSNAEFKSGTESTRSEVAEATFTVTESGTVRLKPSAAVTLYSVKVSSLSGAYLKMMDEAKALLESLEAYPNVKAELETAIADAAVAEGATEEQYGEALDKLNVAISHVNDFLVNIEKLNELVSQAETILASAECEALAQALAQVKALDANTATADDYLAAINALREELAYYNASQVSRDEWNFTQTLYTEIDNVRAYFKVDETNHLAEFIGFNGDLNATEWIMPSYFLLNGEVCPVVAVANEYQYSQSTIQKVTLPKSLRYIGNSAFYYFQALTSMDIPASVEYIDDNAFYRASSLRDIYLHTDTPLACSDNAFYRSSGRLIVHIPDGVFHDYRLSSPWGNYVIVPETPVEINVNVADAGELGRLAVDEAGYLQEINKLVVSGALNNDDWETIKSMSNLIDIDMSGVINTTIPSSQFNGKWAISNVVLPSNLETIESYAFQETGISSIELPQTLKSIYYRAFRNCKSLQSIELPASLTSMDGYTFESCTNLQSVRFNEGLTTIPNSCFSNCNLTELTLPSTLTDIQSSAFANNKKLEKFTSPDALVTIGNSAFSECRALKEVKLNEGLQTLEGYAFAYNDSLSSVTLPSSLRTCANAPFYGCGNLKTIVTNAVVPPSTGNSCPLSGVEMNDVKLMVPSWSLTEYQVADGWNQFYTVEVTDFMPQNVVINKDFVFALRDTLDADYRPNIDLLWTDRGYTDGFGYNNYEHGNLTINSRSKLPVNNFSMYLSPYAKYDLDYNQYNRIVNGSNYYDYTPYNPTCLMVNGEMRAENVTINLMNQNSRWQFISFPFDVRMSDIVPADSLTQWVVREYSGENRASNMLDSTWVDLKKDDVLKAGKGYIMHCYNNNSSPVMFTVTPVKESVNRQALFMADDRTVELDEHIAEFDHNRSWNLVGNPYPTFYDSRFLDFTAPLTIWNSRYNNYMAVSPVDDDFILSPGEAFFVQRPVEQENITFAKEGRQTHNHVRQLQNGDMEQMPRAKAPLAENRQVINIVLQGDETADRTRVVINENATMGYDMNVDASKFDAIDAAVSQLFTVAGNVRYAINERPLGDAVVELGLHVGTEGMFTLKLREDVAGSIVIEDRLNGTMVEITAEKGYTFSIDKAGDVMGRFFIHLNMQQGGTTAIEGVEALGEEDNAPAYNLNGQQIDADTYKGVVVKKGSKRVK